jgi:uncharacterized membrane protein
MNSRARAQWQRPDVRAARIGRTSRRLAVAAIVGVIALVLTGLFWRWTYAPAVGWDAAAIVFTTWIWLVIWPMGATDTAAKARSVDPNRATSDILTLSAAVASIAAVGIVLVGANSARGLTADMLAAFGLISIAISWFTVHTIFTLRYALLYYEGAEGGVSFNQDEPPCYRDFAYLALTIGMTFQVSDTNLQTTAIRAAALRHALLSYLFGTVILAATINLIAGLGSLRGHA